MTLLALVSGMGGPFRSSQLQPEAPLIPLPPCHGGSFVSVAFRLNSPIGLHNWWKRVHAMLFEL